MSNFKPSKYQQGVYEFLKNETGNAIVEAVAGSGKTTTIVNMLNLPCIKGQKVLFVAFNKAIATELQSRVAYKNVEACTLNSFGYRICRANIKGKNGKGAYIKIDVNKVSYILRFEVLKLDKDTKADNEQLKWYYRNRNSIQRLISLAKANMMFKLTANEWEMLAESYSVQVKEDDWQLLGNVLDQTSHISLNTKWVLDFDDQIAMPIYHNWNVPSYDLVCVDEAQDLNPIQQELICRAAKI